MENFFLLFLGVPAPTIYHVDLNRRNIYMEYLNNTITVKKFIDENISQQETFWQLTKLIAKILGNLIGKLHSENIFHGDLTTSNILLRDVSNESKDIKRGIQNNLYYYLFTFTKKKMFLLDQVILIDFGLAHVNCSVEDSAVDLYVLERSLKSAHSKLRDLFAIILEGYFESYIEKKQEERGKQVLNKLKEVRSRGRRRVMIG